MWMLLKKVALALLVGRTFGGALALLATVLLPIAGLLKLVGIPLLLVLLLVGAPVILLLVAIGLPIALVVLAGTVLVALLGGVLTLGVAVLEVVIPMAILFLMLRFVWRLVMKDRDAPPPASGPIGDPPITGVDPAL